MNAEETIVAIVVLSIIGFGIFGWIFSSRDRWNPKTGEKLKNNAKIIDCTTKRYNKYKFKTTITFTDGFEYVSFDTRTEQSGFMGRKIIVDGNMKRKIINKAIAKHKELTK